MENNQLNEEQLQGLFQYAMVFARNRDDAYDLLQTALERYLREGMKGKSISNAEAYIRTIIRTRFIDQYRKIKQRKEEPYEELASYDISPVDLETAFIHSQELVLFWEALTPMDREIFYYWAILGHSTDDACKLLKMPRGTFLSRIHRLRTRYSQNASRFITEDA